MIDHYAWSLGWYTKSAPLFRAWLKRLPADQALRYTDKLVDLFLPWHKRVAHIQSSFAGPRSDAPACYAYPASASFPCRHS